MSALGHSRPSHLAPALNNVCFAPKATEFCGAAKWR